MVLISVRLLIFLPVSQALKGGGVKDCKLASFAFSGAATACTICSSSSQRSSALKTEPVRRRDMKIRVAQHSLKDKAEEHNTAKAFMHGSLRRLAIRLVAELGETCRILY